MLHRPIKKARTSPAKPGIWVGAWEGVTLIDPKSGNLTNSSGVARTFTVARGRAEAERIMRDGLLWCPDVEDPGESANVEELPVMSGEVWATVAFLLKCGARFCMPPRPTGLAIGDFVARLLKD